MRRNKLNISFRDFISISEGKQVGTLYHFTRLGNLVRMLDSNFNMTSNNEYISFTRDYNLLDKRKSNDLSKNASIRGPLDVAIVRISIDGTKLSNKYKIKPFMDIENNVSHKNSEQEEIINGKTDITNYIKQIDVIMFKEYKDTIDNLKKELSKTRLYSKYEFNFITDMNKLKKVK